MWRFIQMWLVLRLLKDQEEHFYSEQIVSKLKLIQGIRATIGISGFVAYFSMHSLWRGALPFWFIKQFRPKTYVEYTSKTGNTENMRTILSILASVKSDGYV